jgi:DNA polymerase-1
MPRLIFDVETNGLLDKLDTIHCLVIRDADTGEVLRFNNQDGPQQTIALGIQTLLEADQIIGHNVIKFDIPAIQKVYPWFKPDMSKVLDTLVYARLVYADLIDIDTKLKKKGQLPGHLFKSQGLEAWGYRLKKNKGDYAKEMKAKGLDPWASWNIEMEDYCVLDTEVTQALLDKLESQGFSQESIDLEMAVAQIIYRQEKHGFCFNTEAAVKLYSELVQRKLVLENKLKDIFKPLYLRDGPAIEPKRDNKKLGYVEGAKFQKLKLTEFNPGSRDHVAHWLKKMYGWEPNDYTADGKPKVDEEVLSRLKYPEAKALMDYFLLLKRVGQLAEGKEAWLKKEKSGYIHGSVITNGAVTGRATHSSPNLGQVPSVRVDKEGHVLYGEAGGWGAECRALFRATPGNDLVGIDMSGVELRCLAHYMARYDGGDYAKVILEGDIHTVNQHAAGLPTRAAAKTFIYAFLYGAGSAKIGSIVGKGAKEGQLLKDRFLAQTPALGSLVKAVGAAASRGYLIGLDGRKVAVRSKHAALNTLLQSAGAILSKQWIVFVHQELDRQGLSDKVKQVVWVHDEIGLDCEAGVGETVGRIAVEAVRKAGEHFKFRCPLDGEYKVGTDWSATH